MRLEYKNHNKIFNWEFLANTKNCEFIYPCKESINTPTTVHREKKVEYPRVNKVSRQLVVSAMYL